MAVASGGAGTDAEAVPVDEEASLDDAWLERRDMGIAQEDETVDGVSDGARWLPDGCADCE